MHRRERIFLTFFLIISGAQSLPQTTQWDDNGKIDRQEEQWDLYKTCSSFFFVFFLHLYVSPSSTFLLFLTLAIITRPHSFPSTFFHPEYHAVSSSPSSESLFVFKARELHSICVFFSAKSGDRTKKGPPICTHPSFLFLNNGLLHPILSPPRPACQYSPCNSTLTTTTTTAQDLDRYWQPLLSHIPFTSTPA